MSNLQAQVLNRFESLIEVMMDLGYDDLQLHYQAPNNHFSADTWSLPYLSFEADALWASQLSQLVSQKRSAYAMLGFNWAVTAHYGLKGAMSWRLSVSNCPYKTSEDVLTVLKSDLTKLLLDLGGEHSDFMEYAEAV